MKALQKHRPHVGNLSSRRNEHRLTEVERPMLLLRRDQSIHRDSFHPTFTLHLSFCTFHFALLFNKRLALHGHVPILAAAPRAVPRSGGNPFVLTAHLGYSWETPAGCPAPHCFDLGVSHASFACRPLRLCDDCAVFVPTCRQRRGARVASCRALRSCGPASLVATTLRYPCQRAR